MSGSYGPFRQLVLKVHSRCDLACDHCYVYEHADQSWHTKPLRITRDRVSWTALRLLEHAKSHQLSSVQVVLHGGEPLLLGPRQLRSVCAEFTAAFQGVCALDLRIHTNGVQLREHHLDLFAEFGVKVGISLDGDRQANDRHRRFADGRSSYDQVLDAVTLLNQDRYRPLFAGILCTVDVRNDPVAVHDALLALDPPRIDFLLPHATWDTPPPRPDGVATPYADWLLKVHDRWSALGHPVPVRLFDSIDSTLRGGPSDTEGLGLEAPGIVVVETDGTYEQTDSLKTTHDNAPATGMNVFEHSLDAVADHLDTNAPGQGPADLCAQCRGCPVVHSCGGGLLAHRYRGATGFHNPSVFCADLMALIRGIDRGTAADEDRVIGAFDPMADGTDDGDAVRELAAGRRRLTHQLLNLVGQERSAQADPLWRASWRLAQDLARRDGELLEPLLAHPYTRTWAARCLDGAAPPEHLASLMAALAPACETPVDVPVRDGFVHLPGRGRLAVRTARATVGVTAADLVGPQWEPLRSVRTDGLHVVLDDLDLYRDCFDAPVCDRPDDIEAERRRRVLEQAWALVRTAVPAVAHAMTRGVRVITPLAAPAPERVLPGGGFTALGVHLTADPVRVAVDLVRGFRAGLLDALLDQCTLYAETDTRTGTLLLDTYARAATDPLLRDPADSRRTRTQWEVLSAAPSLTPLGRRFVDGIGRSL
ncbi:FxsB family cyclophane-forming radical SAM/SPASM peptide maturase [Streptomyces sp. NPDC051913]|uniref:FxsB family cyclophane-forming radical SAM/SPASM peptide maturase n=1 Tax=Streptomyces sp. NPDC051913 TaxID=3365676 RepID=UPI0037D0895C